MKKILALSTTAILSVGIMAGCGDMETDEPTPTEDTEVEVPVTSDETDLGEPTDREEELEMREETEDTE